MPAVFDKLGIRFLYPDNWTLDEDEAVEGNNSVTVLSPKGAFWSITLHPKGMEPKLLASTALKAIQTEYQDSESEPVSEQIGEKTIAGYDINFFFMDLTSTAVIRAFRMDDASCMILCQAEDREFEQFAPVFRAITTSLLSEKT